MQSQVSKFFLFLVLVLMVAFALCYSENQTIYASTTYLIIFSHAIKTLVLGPCSVSAFLLIAGIRLAFVFTCRVSLVLALILASLVKTRL